MDVGWPCSGSCGFWRVQCSEQLEQDVLESISSWQSGGGGVWPRACILGGMAKGAELLQGGFLLHERERIGLDLPEVICESLRSGVS